MNDVIAKVALVVELGQKFTPEENRALEGILNDLLAKICDCYDISTAENLMDQLGEFQTELARACFKWNIELPPKLRRFVREFDRSDDSELRLGVFNEIKAGKFPSMSSVKSKFAISSINLSSHHRSPLHAAVAYKMHFVRSLTGDRADRFKKAFIIHFREDLSIKCAYFVEIEKPDGSKAQGLCIKAPYADHDAVMTGVKEVYSQFYGPDDHLDVIFLSPRQEIEMEGQCMPFYDIQDEAHRLVTNGKPGLLSTMTARVAESCLGDKPFLEAARREPQGPTDSGWTFYSHSGAQDDPAKTETWTLLQIFKKDPSFLRWVDAPIGTALWRTDARFEWRDLAEKPQPGTFRLPPADGPGPFAANESPKRFGDGNNREDAKPGGGSHPPDDAPLRTYLDLNPRREPPADINLYYECLACGGILPSVTPAEQKCLCGNVTSKNGHILIKNFAKARLFRQE